MYIYIYIYIHIYIYICNTIQYNILYTYNIPDVIDFETVWQEIDQNSEAEELDQNKIKTNK